MAAISGHHVFCGVYDMDHAQMERLVDEVSLGGVLITWLIKRLHCGSNASARGLTSSWQCEVVLTSMWKLSIDSL